MAHAQANRFHLGSADRPARDRGTRSASCIRARWRRNPVMFVVEVGSVLTTLRLVRTPLAGRGGLGFEFQITFWLWLTVLFANFARSDGRGARQGAGRHAAQGQDRDGRQPRASRRLARDRCAAPTLRKGDVVRVDGGRGHPGGRRDHRGRRVGGRERHHRRVGAGHPRVGRRPLGGDRRHARAVGLDSRAGHGRTRARRSSTG